MGPTLNPLRMYSPGLVQPQMMSNNAIQPRLGRAKRGKIEQIRLVSEGAGILAFLKIDTESLISYVGPPALSA